MEFVRIESKSGVDINAILKCEHCNSEEMVYGKDTEAWYSRRVPQLTCKRCGKGGLKINAEVIK